MSYYPGYYNPYRSYYNPYYSSYYPYSSYSPYSRYRDWDYPATYRDWDYTPYRSRSLYYDRPYTSYYPAYAHPLDDVLVEEEYLTPARKRTVTKNLYTGATRVTYHSP